MHSKRRNGQPRSVSRPNLGRSRPRTTDYWVRTRKRRARSLPGTPHTCGSPCGKHSIPPEERNHDQQWLFTKLTHISAKDINGDGTAEMIQKKRFVRYMRYKVDLEEKVVRKLWKDMDVPKRGMISAQQFERYKL